MSHGESSLMIIFFSIAAMAFRKTTMNVEKKYISFLIRQVLDDKDMHRRFRMSNFQSTTRVRPFCTSMPIGLSGGWNQIQFNLTLRTSHGERTGQIMSKLHAYRSDIQIQVRRIYFADR